METELSYSRAEKAAAAATAAIALLALAIAVDILTGGGLSGARRAAGRYRWQQATTADQEAPGDD